MLGRHIFRQRFPVGTLECCKRIRPVLTKILARKPSKCHRHHLFWSLLGRCRDLGPVASCKIARGCQLLRSVRCCFLFDQLYIYIYIYNSLSFCVVLTWSLLATCWNNTGMEFSPSCSWYGGTLHCAWTSRTNAGCLAEYLTNTLELLTSSTLELLTSSTLELLVFPPSS